ncbi:MAG: right-handed parallel beta-helix repeat-containing protein [Kiritimatiellae bacterium]|nr:right-handed parallel beta-helix repeat-containing protein [Kiritimatiellia bacterium]
MAMRTLLSLGLAALTASLCAEPRPDLVEKVKAGELKEARASWWGFDKEDATRFLQAAIDSGVPRLIVDRMEGPWVVLPLKGVSNQEIFFEPGSEVRAKRGAYRGKGECLFRFPKCSNVRLIGYGATVGMWHEDYMQPPYEKSEWRHALSFLSCSNVVVKGLTIARSGGDGIYLGVCTREFPRNRDVVIRDVLCHDNHRQGISVISAENLLIENTVLRETHGTAPAAGIDFEPNHPDEVLKNCVMRNCLTVNNEGAGYTTWAGQLNRKSEPIDIRFENCTAFGDRTAFHFATDSRSGRDVGGRVVLRNCRFEKPRTSPAVQLRENRFGTLAYDIADSVIVQTNTAGVELTSYMNDNWMKINLPLQKDPDFSLPHVSDPDLAHAEIFDAAPGKAVKLQPMRVRHQARYLVYADRARTLHFTGHQCRVGRYAAATKPMRVTGTDGKAIAQIPLPGHSDAPFSFDAPAAGFYRIDLDLGSVAFTFTSSDAPVALDLTDSVQGLISSVGSMWFAVPRGTRKLGLYVSGDGVERVHAALYSPQDVQVWDADNISNWTKAVVTPPPPGLWRIESKRPSLKIMEDVKYDLAGVPAFLFLSDEKTWCCQ